MIGIGIGRGSDDRSAVTAAPAQPATVAVAQSAGDPRTIPALDRPYEVETSQYLGQTAALLIALPSEVKAGRTDQQFAIARRAIC